MNQMQTSNLVDPFQGQSILTLNPRRFRDSKDALKSKDLEAIHQHMNSMALRSPDKHFEKAKSVLDGGLEILNIKEREANTKEKENPQDHRPGLARKRAKFSLKSDTSQPSTIMEPSFQINQLQDPEEFFAAYEKLENTRKEIKRQRGGEELDEAKNPTTARHPRPEIPRRKVSYKHHEYSSQSKNDASFTQDKLQDNIGSPATQSLQQESVTPNLQSKEEEVVGSVAKTKDRVNKLFDDLMASKIDKLDGNEALSFLKDRLKIKSVKVNKLQLPEFHDIPRVDFISPIKNLIKDQSIMFDSCALSDGIKEKTLGKQKKLSDNPFHSLASRPPSRSPLLAISTFGKHMLKSIESNDPFSACDIDSLPSTTSTEIIGGHPTHVSKDPEFSISGTTNSVTKNKVTITAVGDVSQRVSGGASIKSPESDKPLNDNNRHSVTTLSESLINMEVHDQCHNMDERNVDDNAVSTCVVTDIQTNEGNVKDMVQKAPSVTKPNFNVADVTDDVYHRCIQDICDNIEEVTETVGLTALPELNVEVSMTEGLSQPGANSIEDLDASRPTQVPDIASEQQNEVQKHPRASMNKSEKTTRTRKVDLKKRRQSLAEAGTSWTSGVRRSNRIRRRPLEYWKGERLLYGRVHNSLPTVIGVKYLSPTKYNGKPGFKVQSFVGDKYKELVDLIALH